MDGGSHSKGKKIENTHKKRDCHENVCVSLAKSIRKHDPIEQAIQVLHLCFESILLEKTMSHVLMVFSKSFGAFAFCVF